MKSKKMKKRKYVYVQQPYLYGISCNKCNGKNITWSEFEGKIWCFDCKIDTDGTDGIFDGPVPIKTAQLLGMSFDKINIKTGKVIKFDSGEKE